MRLFGDMGNGLRVAFLGLQVQKSDEADAPAVVRGTVTNVAVAETTDVEASHFDRVIAVNLHCGDKGGCSGLQLA